MHYRFILRGQTRILSNLSTSRRSTAKRKGLNFEGNTLALFTTPTIPCYLTYSSHSLPVSGKISRDIPNSSIGTVNTAPPRPAPLPNLSPADFFLFTNVKLIQNRRRCGTGEKRRGKNTRETVYRRLGEMELQQGTVRRTIIFK